MSRDPAQEGPDYRCKSCGEIVPRGTHHKMTSCKCGKVSVDRGWYGSRVLWTEGRYEDAVEQMDCRK